MSTLRARLAIVLAALAASAAVSACGGGDDGAAGGDAAATSTATAPATSATTEDTSAEEPGSPESNIAPDAEVTAGLKKLKGVAAAVAAVPDGDARKEAAEGLEQAWEPIEGTVKRNEPDLYLGVEDSFALLASGDSGDAQRGRQRLDQAVDAYLARHPG